MNSQPALLASNLLLSMKSRLRDAARWVRYLPDRILHPYRRRRAREALRDLSPDIQAFLFVCQGNICRSPFAAELFACKHGEKRGMEANVLSAGFHSAIGREAPEPAVEAARSRGVDLSEHRSRTIADALDAARTSERALCVLVMDARQRERLVRRFHLPHSRIFVLGDFDPQAVPRREIRDPYGGALEDFDEVYGRIERCVKVISSCMNE